MPFRSLWPVILLLALFQQQVPRPPAEQDLRISGIVVDELTGLPLAEAEVAIARTGGSTSSQTVSTGADGRFLFAHLEPGKYLLTAKRRGFAQQAYQQHEFFSTAVAVETGLDSENLVFRLLLGASIFGQVTDEFIDPIRNAQVMLFREGVSNGKRSVQLRGQITTDDEGRYRFGGLFPGRYYIAVSAQPWYALHMTLHVTQPTDLGASIVGLRPVVEQNTGLDVVYPITYYSGATEPARASAITLQPGERAMADLALQPVPALHLRVKAPCLDFSQGMGVQATQTMFDGHETYLPARITAINKDYVEVDGIPPGHVIIGLEAGNGKERHSWRRDVEASRDAELDLTESAAFAVISGIVRAAETTGLPQPASIGIHNGETSETFYAPISAEGEFEFHNHLVRPGKYDLSVLNLPGFYVDHVQATGAKVSGRGFEFQSSEPVRLTVDISQGLGRVDGVALRNGKPAAGVMILLVPHELRSNPSLFQRDQSDSDGTFTLSSVPPGRYTLVAIENGWDQEWAKPSVLKQWLSGGEAVQVAPNWKYTIKVRAQ